MESSTHPIPTDLTPRSLTKLHLPLVESSVLISRARYSDLPGHSTCRSIAREALWRAALRYRSDRGASFKTYAYYRLLGSLRDARRHRYRTRDALASGKGIALEEWHRARQPLSPRPGCPDRAADRLRQARAVLEYADAQLDGRTRQVVMAHAVGGYSLRELGRMLGVSYREVRGRYHAGLAALRDFLEAQPEA